MRNRKKVFGVGINDSEYETQGKAGRCPFYDKWVAMLKRCYSGYNHYKSYSGCVVCEDWLRFSSFKGWMEQQDWEGKSLDKDLLGDGKLYSADTCCFLSSGVNVFLAKEGKHTPKKGLPVGVFKNNSKFTSRCTNPITHKRECLGTFKTAEMAGDAYKNRKKHFANLLADLESDKRISDALRTTYSTEL